MVYPFQPWSHNQASIRSTPSEASSSNHNVCLSFSFDSQYSATSITSIANVPPPPPPSPCTNDLTDITPRKCSFSTGYDLNNSCAFPSWPKRQSLLGESDGSTASAYVSDEDLGIDCAIPCDMTVDEESAAPQPTPAVGASLTTEQQIQMLRAAAEEEAQRARFLAQVQAHARAQQALRVGQLATLERENSKRKKRRAIVPERRRRTSSKPLRSS